TLAKTKLNQLQLIIKDDGVGIDLEKMKREHKGAGLKNIERRVSLLNGKLNLETAPNQGTCYTIVVPLANL
ncbi:MAG: histidine kinase, partial [Flavobacteriales bacterium CG_4_8_14_3_um_filter_35_10]